MEEEKKQPDVKNFSEIIADAFKELNETVIAFFKAPKALWGVNVPYIIEGLVYFGILTILGKYSSENLSVNDAQAGLIYSFVTGGITFSMLVLGGVSDKIGVRKSLALSFIFFLVGRFLVALSGSLPLGSGLWSPMFFLMTFGLLIMVLAYGLYQPAAYAGVKRYTTPKTAAMAYGAIYGFMNLGAFLSGFISSFTRQSFENIFPPNGLTAVYWVYVALTASALIVSLVILTKKNDAAAVASVLAETGNASIDADEEKKSAQKINNTKAIAYALSALLFFLLSEAVFNIAFNFHFTINLIAFRLTLDLYSLLAAIAFVLAIVEYLRQRPLHPFRDKRFSYFIFILIPVQTLFAHNWLTIPYYLDRAFAGSFVGNYFEIFSNLNPILIFILAPLVAGLTARVDVYRMMILGTTVMALPTFLLAIGPNAYLFLLYILLMTIGEAMWQPRFLQWIAEVAPKGMTGLYMGVGQFPWFLTKVITGFYSGWFLMHYCPIDTLPAQMNTQFMWMVYALIAIVSPIGLILAKNWMKKGFKVKADDE